MNYLAVSSKRVQRFEGKLNFGLCDLRDYFAGPLLLIQNKFDLTVTFLSKKTVN